MGKANKIAGSEAPTPPVLLADLNLPRTATPTHSPVSSAFDWYANSRYTNSQVPSPPQPSRSPRYTNWKYLAPAIILSILSSGGLAAGAASTTTCKNPSDCRDSNGTLFGITGVMTGAAAYCYYKAFPPAN